LAYHSKKINIKLLRLCIIEGSILKFRVPSLWPTYKGDKWTTFVKEYGIKVESYWELFGEHVMNLGTLCMESSLCIVQMESDLPPPTTRKKGRPTRLLIGCMEIVFLKLVATIFGLDQ
jgi:hypothetical protein